MKMIFESTNHPEQVLQQIQDPVFAAMFSDIRLVFEGGEVVDYYRALVSLLSKELGELLQQTPTSDALMLTGMDVKLFFNQITLIGQEGFNESLYFVEKDGKYEGNALSTDGEVDMLNTRKVEHKVVLLGKYEENTQCHKKSSYSETKQVPNNTRKENHNRIRRLDDSGEQFKCNICEKIFRCRWSLETQHIKLMHTPSLLPIKCTKEFCNEDFSTKYEMIQHLQSCSFTCQYCGKVFTRSCRIKGHMRRCIGRVSSALTN